MAMAMMSWHPTLLSEILWERIEETALIKVMGKSWGETHCTHPLITQNSSGDVGLTEGL